ncbi:L-glyceraldehyde 3-phosphate reductase [Hymenobacter caeli]|uniref:L-glyceraldehyde 3-phosphate reductase n=1 Tax=Hymenobacter caeli TaxID=2735894 RepID=A0ABX2FL81_9BACT|nr:L-glyceraldehyde 3-phosphate reductase [Hymenobacter caeli]NRT17771.1 L-glyceraldehyde 3-phosphate reductase [Hymenobacter caeli]
MTNYLPAEDRYQAIPYRRCGKSGLKLPALSLGLWQNFGDVDLLATGRATLRLAFDRGVTHFDLANNYGPPPGSAELNFGKIMQQDFAPYRDELIISTKAGYGMWDGPYGEWGSRKYLLASLDQSLKRMGLEYVDIFYHHRPDPDTPLEESMGALAHAVRQGKALYVGLSNYPPALAQAAIRLLREMGTPCLIHQPKYSMLVRDPEAGLLEVLAEEGVGCIPFSPLAQGLLSGKYLKGIPDGSRAARDGDSLRPDQVTPALVAQLQSLNEIAQARGQSLAQMALSWLLKDDRVTSVLVGASRPEQLADSLDCLKHLAFSPDELDQIEHILQKPAEKATA